MRLRMPDVCMTPLLIDVSGLSFPCRIAATRFAPAQPSHGVVLAVHGLTRQKRDFDDMARHLAAAGYTVYCVDVPGRGGSSWLPRPQDYTLETYAQVLTALIDQQGWGAVHWVGASMGGLIALTLPAIGRSDVLRSLTLVDVTQRPNPSACARIADYMPENAPLITDPTAYLALVKQYLPLGPVSEDVWRRFADHQLVKVPGGYAFHFDPALVPGAKAALAAGIDLTSELSSLTCPIALVAGALSDLCGQREIDDLLAVKPQTPVFICPGAGHIPALADTASTAFIAAFMAQATGPKLGLKPDRSFR